MWLKIIKVKQFGPIWNLGIFLFSYFFKQNWTDQWNYLAQFGIWEFSFLLYFSSKIEQIDQWNYCVLYNSCQNSCLPMRPLALASNYKLILIIWPGGHAMNAARAQKCSTRLMTHCSSVLSRPYSQPNQSKAKQPVPLLVCLCQPLTWHIGCAYS